jgi:hypothetical protein
VEEDDIEQNSLAENWPARIEEGFGSESRIWIGLGWEQD